MASETATTATPLLDASKAPTMEPCRHQRPVKKFAPIVSPLDPADLRSGVHTSEFRGMYNLAIIAATIYTVTTWVSNLVSRGVFSDPRLLVSVFYSQHFIEVLVTFACQGVFAYTAMIPVYLASTRWFSHRVLVNSVHHFFQSVLFCATVVFIIYRDWNAIHAVSAFVECVVLLMKMHSYIRTQLELARRSENKPQPHWKDFTVYLFHPTLVYEPSFPRTEHIRWGYVVEKVVANTLAMSMLYIIVTDHVMPVLEDSAVNNPSGTNPCMSFSCAMCTWKVLRITSCPVRMRRH